MSFWSWLSSAVDKRKTSDGSQPAARSFHAGLKPVNSDKMPTSAQTDAYLIVVRICSCIYNGK